jgi:hypothetical protein
MDFMKPEPDPDGESFLTYQDENKLIDIEEKDAIIMKFPVKNSEYEVSHMSACPLLILFVYINTKYPM